MINGSRTYVIFSGYFCKILWDPLVRSSLHSLFSLYASGPHLSSLTYLSLNPHRGRINLLAPPLYPIPAPSVLAAPGTARCELAAARSGCSRRRPLWLFPAPPAPSSPPRAPVRARRRRPCPSSPTSASRRARRARTWASSPTPESGGPRRAPHLGELAHACIWQSSPAPALGRFRHSQACWLLPVAELAGARPWLILPRPPLDELTGAEPWPELATLWST
jgi:hypothetical protein